MTKKRTDRPHFIYPEYITESVLRLSEASYSKKYPLLNKRIDLIHLLLNQLNDYPVTEQVYSWVWRMLNKMAFCKNVEWIQSYWSYANQYYTIKLEYSSDIEAKKRFQEFHLMVGVLMVYMKEYELIRNFFTYTSSLPPRYPLIPSTFATIFLWYKQLSKKNERFYLLKYGIIGLNEGAKDDSIIESSLLDYLALLLIRLNKVNDYNITYSNPMAFPPLGDTIEEVLQNQEITKTLKNRVLKWEHNKGTIRKLGYKIGDSQQAIALINEFQESCDLRIKELTETAHISKDKQEILKQDLIQAIDKYPIDIPMPTLTQSSRTVLPKLSEQKVELDERLILSNYDYISNNLGEALVNGIYVELRHYYCYQFLLQSAVRTFLVPYRNLSEALKRLKLDNSYVLLAMGVSAYLFDETEGFERIQNNKIIYQGVDVICIASNENSMIIMKKADIPTIELRDLKDNEVGDKQYEIDTKHHFYSNIDSITTADKPIILTVRVGYNLYLPQNFKYIRLRIAYQLDTDQMLIDKIQSINNYIV